METSVQRAGERPAVARWLLTFGAIGPLLNIAVVIVLGAIRPHYNALQVPDSALELGEGGWIQITNYVVSGALLLGFAFGLSRALRSGRGSTWGPILLGIYGLTFVGAAIFVTDPASGYPPGASGTETFHGFVHDLFGLLQFISVIAASFVLARRYAADPAGRGWFWYSVATGLVVLASYVVFVLMFISSGPAGLTERVGIFAGNVWIALVAIRLLRRNGPGAPARQMAA
jgi:hypothetical protein